MNKNRWRKSVKKGQLGLIFFKLIQKQKNAATFKIISEQKTFKKMRWILFFTCIDWKTKKNPWKQLEKKIRFPRELFGWKTHNPAKNLKIKK